jgi:CheY-like chemotaxis protein
MRTAFSGSREKDFTRARRGLHTKRAGIQVMTNDAVELAAPVLLIDDDEDSRVMYRTILAHAGIEVVTVTDGGDGLQVARAVKPSVIVLDIGLPTMSGLEVLQRVRQDSNLNGTAVIALTGRVLQEQQQELADAGFDNVLMKPIEPTTVLAAVVDAMAPERQRLEHLPPNSESRPEVNVPPPPALRRDPSCGVDPDQSVEQ